MSDQISREELYKFLSEDRMQSVDAFSIIDSTNTRLLELARSGNVVHGQVAVAGQQTAGKGRKGRGFESPNKGVYLSILLEPDSLPGDIVSITAWTGVAISNAIYNVSGVRPGIKWINDLLINNKKVCGILAEGVINNGKQEYVVIGIGVNVSESIEDFPEEIRGIASSIRLEMNNMEKESGTCLKQFTRAELAAEMIKELDRMYKSWPEGKEEYLDSYRRHCVTVGRDIIIGTDSDNAENRKRGKAIGVNEDFSLKAELEDGSIINLQSGEVSVRGLYGYA